MDNDRNLLFGVLAIQLELVDTARFADACAAWATRKDVALADLLVERGWISSEEKADIERLLERKLRRHGGDERAALGAVADDRVRQTLRSLDDPSIRSSLADLPPLSGNDVTREGEGTPPGPSRSDDTELAGASPPGHVLTSTIDRFPETREGDLPTVPGADPPPGPSPPAGPESPDGSPQGHVLISTIDRFPETRERYTLTRLHATGGLGRVWLARDPKIGRQVALKEIRPEVARNPRVWSRFLEEARITAQLEHPGIVPIYEVGKQGDAGSPFYTMRFIRGRTLSEVIDAFHARRAAGDPWALEQLALLNAFIGVCQAVAFAHSQGVIHRDLKGQNIVVGDFGEVIVLDWGLAKQAGGGSGVGPEAEPIDVDREGGRDETAHGQVLGTPAYMAPEQAEGRIDLVDRRSDIYSLGAILYEVLTGRPPFRGSSLSDVLRLVREGKLEPPRRVRPDASPALEAVCLKAMAKDPERRYESAGELASEVQRWLADEPVHAWPEPWIVRLRRWAARHRTAVAGAAASVIVATVALAIATLLLGRANAREALARHHAEEARERAEAHLYLDQIALADREWRANFVVKADRLLEECPSGRRGWEWRYLRRQSHADLLTFDAHSLPVQALAASPDGTRIASAGGAWGTAEPGELKVWDLGSGRMRSSFRGHRGAILALAFGPDGRRLASAGEDGTVRVWDAATGREELTLRGHDGKVQGVAFRPDDRRIASAGEDRSVRIWDAATGKELLTLRGHTHRVSCVAFSPDGRQLVSGSQDWSVRLWETETGVALHTLQGHGDGVEAVAFSPDGTRIASASGWGDETVKLWDVREGRERFTFRGHTGLVRSVAFSPDGTRIASGSWDRTVRIWDAASGRQHLLFRTYSTVGVNGLAFGADGRRLASAADRLIQIWDARAAPEATTLGGHDNAVVAVAFHPDGRRLASGGWDRRVRLWDAATGREGGMLRIEAGEVQDLAFSPDGLRLAVAVGSVSVEGPGVVEVWDWRAGAVALTLRGHTTRVRRVVYRGDGARLASAGDRTVRVWDSATAREVAVFSGHTADIVDVAFNPDGTRLASAGEDGTVRIWEAASGRELRSIRGGGYGVVFSPDGARIASAANEEKSGKWTLTVWEVATGRAVLSLDGGMPGMTFSPDGTRIAGPSQGPSVKVWDAANGGEYLALMGHTSDVRRVVFSPDGARIASASHDTTAKVWDATPPAPRPRGE